jgi:hypothetical protein
MDKAIIVFSRKGLMREAIEARHVRSREHARKLWPLVAPDERNVLLTWVSPHFRDGRVLKRSHFRTLFGRAGINLKERFDHEEAERVRQVSESLEHARAKELIAAELRERIASGRRLPWAFKDDNASDFPLIGNLLAGATEVIPEHQVKTPFGSTYRLDIAVLGDPVPNFPNLLAGIEIERRHHFDGRKALIGRSMGFPLITVDITDMSIENLTDEWAASVLTNTTRDDPEGRRQSYVYLHDLLYPQFLAIPTEVEKDPKHQYLVFADDATIDRLDKCLRRVAHDLGYPQGQVSMQKLNGKSPSARVALQTAGGIVGTGWQDFNSERCLRISVPRPLGQEDVRAHRLHTTIAWLLLNQDCLVGYQYAASVQNDPVEDLWLRYRWRPDHRMHEIFRLAPKRLAEPIGRLMNFLHGIEGAGRPDST